MAGPPRAFGLKLRALSFRRLDRRGAALELELELLIPAHIGIEREESYDEEEDEDEEDEEGGRGGASDDSETIPGLAGFGDPGAAFLSSSSSSSEGEEDEGDGDGPHSEQKALDDFELRVNRLPDHLFEAAFAAPSSSATATPNPKSKRKSTPPTAQTTQPSRKRLRPDVGHEDLQVGVERVRALGTAASGAHRALLAGPSRRVNEFLDWALALKGTGKKRLGWERRPANIGLMRSTSGPAANFVGGRSALRCEISTTPCYELSLDVFPLPSSLFSTQPHAPDIGDKYK
ncbi:hypothetical protein FA13DRAFT_1793293 [Coprinellus micaceus]|uniref:Uncharacterized protein n=1 Tax=Coprinellus micaceus TaxID=71717 RepID=A0A4Y7T4U9_COPMI|nr:hypothetical protein FA13DRAFT_1793293 [Coprinellus micaceus]